MSQEVKPLDMRDIGFTPNPDLDELRPPTSQSDTVECYVYSELHEVRKHFVIPLNDPNAVKTLLDYRQKYVEVGKDQAAYYFMERDRKPDVLLAHYKGPIKHLNLFITGRQVEDGTGVVTSKSTPAHPRTWISAIPGAYGNPPTYITDKKEVIKRIEAEERFTKIMDVGEFSELERLIAENERSRRR